MELNHESERRAPFYLLAPLVWGLVISGLYASSLHSYLLFHSLAEFFSIAVAFAIFAIAWNTRHVIDSHYVLFIGISTLFSGILDLFHTLSYKGLVVFPGYDANLPTQLWIAFRYIFSASMLMAPLFITRKLNAALALAIYFPVTVSLLAAIFLGHFPDCYIEGSGLTQFKIVSEYVICLLLVVSLILLIRRKNSLDESVVRLMAISIISSIISELSFTKYVSVYGFANMLGHYFEVVSYYFIYRAIVVTGLIEPSRLFFRNLSQTQKQLIEANSRLEAANKELESFAYSVSHDLRAPLRAIDGFSRIVLEDYAGRIDEEGGRLLNIIRSNACKMGQLIDDLLSFSRMGRQGITLMNIDMAELAHSVIADLKPSCAGRDIHLTIGELPAASGDYPMIRQVFANLLSNAIKFTAPVAGAVIEIGGRNSKNENIYYVKDNGVGFNMKYENKLFGVFQRLHATDEFEGTGVGLAIVRRIIGRHKGRVWAESRENEGAIFYFTLPVPEAQTGNASGNP